MESVVVVILCVKRWKYTKPLLFFQFLYYGLLMAYPVIFNRIISPDNNLEEDLIWNCYSWNAYWIILLGSLMVTLLVWILNKYIWNADSLYWIKIMAATALVFSGSLLLLLCIRKMTGSSIPIFIAFIAALLFSLLCAKRRTVSQTKQ